MRKKAFTIVEILIVMAIIAVLTSVGFFGFNIFRDSIAVGNTSQAIKSMFRDVQDKALTASTYNDDLGQYSTYKNHWLYGYSIEYNPTIFQYEMYSIIDDSTTIPLTASNTVAVRNVFGSWNSGNGCRLTSTISLAAGTASCHLEKGFSFDAEIDTASSNCDILYTSVNGKITFKNAATTGTTCKVHIKRNTTDVSLTMSNSGIGTIKICQGNNLCT